MVEKLTFMRITCMLVVSLAVVMFSVQGQASIPRIEASGDQHRQLEFEEAVRAYDQSAGRVERLKAEFFIEMADQFGISTLDELIALMRDPEYEDVTAPYIETIDETEELISDAANRLLQEEDHARLVPVLLAMSDWDLVELIDMSAYALRVDQAGRVPAFRQAFHTSAGLQERLLLLLDKESNIIDMALDQSVQRRLEELGVPNSFISWEDYAANRRILLPTIQLLPVSRRLALLQDILSGYAYQALRPELVEVIESGYFSGLVELPEEWLRDRIESGETLWLSYVAGRHDDSDLPLLYQKIDQLELQQQLQLILINPDPMFFPLVARIHTDLMLALPCSDHELDEELASQASKLVEILLYLRAEEPDSLLLLDELAGCLPRSFSSWSLSRAASSLLNDEDAASKSMAIRLYTNFVHLEINPHALHEAWAHDAEASRQLLALRVPYLSQTLLEQDGKGDNFGQCSRLTLLLMATGHGLFDAWPEWLAEWTEGDLRASALEYCGFNLANVVAMHPEAFSLDALLALWESGSVPIESYMLLTRSILRTEGPLHERKLAALTDYLHQTGRWDELPVPYPAMLEGRAGLEALRLSCEASSDWEPDDEAEQTVAEEPEPEVVTAE